MKYCEQYAALLDLFVDGELAGAEMERVRDHLAECPGCQAYVDDALAIRAGFPDIEDTAVPEGFAEGVMERIREASAGERKLVELRRRGIRRWMGTAAALAACCALVILVRTGPGKEAAAPAGGDGAAYDTAAIIEDGEAGIAPQAALEATEAPVEEPLEEVPSPRSRTAEAYKSEQVLTAAPAAGADLPAPVAAAPEAAMDDSAPEKTDALYLTAEEAGDLLDGFDPVWESGGERRYELSAEAYRTLLEALGRPVDPVEAAEERFLVVVTGLLE